MNTGLFICSIFLNIILMLRPTFPYICFSIILSYLFFSYCNTEEFIQGLASPWKRDCSLHVCLVRIRSPKSHGKQESLKSKKDWNPTPNLSSGNAPSYLMHHTWPFPRLTDIGLYAWLSGRMTFPTSSTVSNCSLTEYRDVFHIKSEFRTTML